MHTLRELSLLFIGSSLLWSCGSLGGEKNEQAHLTAIEKTILTDTSSPYYIDFSRYVASNPRLPIGVFDSGTGGLTVLDALVRYDQHHNMDGVHGADGKLDFAKERFIYLADQANMPYGNYHAAEKSDLLVEHIIKDVQFLLGNHYYTDASALQPRGKKQQVKAIVIACNTATAYGKENVEAFIRNTGVDIPVIGVIDAGARGALDKFASDESGAIGVFATVGTIASEGYEKTLMRIKDERGYTGNIQVFNQGGHGVAEAVDEEPDFVDHEAKAPRKDYRGPALDDDQFPIERALLDVYGFNFSDHGVLCDSESALDCQILQLNSSENYVRYHLVALLEKMRKQSNAQPLKALLLGCTHYPYLTQEIKQVLGELYDFKREGKYVYRHLLSKQVHIVDPAENVAEELYAYLHDEQLWNPEGDMQGSEFFISVPNSHNENVVLDSMGRFTYAYKYGRNAGEVQEYVKVVPFDKSNIPKETIERMQLAIPQTFQLIDGIR